MTKSKANGLKYYHKCENNLLCSVCSPINSRHLVLYVKLLEHVVDNLNLKGSVFFIEHLDHFIMTNLNFKD